MIARAALVMLCASGAAWADSAVPNEKEKTGARFEERCAARLSAAAHTLDDLGSFTVGMTRERKPIRGVQVSFLLLNSSLFARVEVDHSGPRYRGGRGIYDKQYGSWHAPLVDSVPADDGLGLAFHDRPLLLDEEFHHRTPVGDLRGEVSVDRASPDIAARFAAVMKPAVEACFADLRPEDLDPSLRWRKPCEVEIRRAAQQLVARDPAFSVGEVTLAGAFDEVTVAFRNPNERAGLSFSADVAEWEAGADEPWHAESKWNAVRREGRFTARVALNGSNVAPASSTALNEIMRPALDACIALGRAHPSYR
jgi:hypothetical protein